MDKVTNQKKLKKIIFAAPKSDEEYILHAIYRDPELKDEWNKAANRTILAKAVSIAIVKLAQLIDNNVGDFIDLMFYKHGDFTIAKECYSAMTETLNLSTDEIQQINVQQIISTLNAKN